MSAPALAFDGVRHAYDGPDGRVETLADIDLAVGSAEFVCVLGPSGCGKTTMLRLAAGFMTATAGRTSCGGADVCGPGPDRGVVLQRHSLFPWETVRGNVEFGPRHQGASAASRRARADALLTAVGLAEFADFYPRALSEGMRQRAALARALAVEPAVLLMDEPFGALDALTRRQMQDLLVEVWAAKPRAVLFVTHDVDEALFLADRVVVLSARPGRVVLERAVPSPREHDAAYAPETRGLRDAVLGALGVV